MRCLPWECRMFDKLSVETNGLRTNLPFAYLRSLINGELQFALGFIRQQQVRWVG